MVRGLIEKAEAVRAQYGESAMRACGDEYREIRRYWTQI